MLCCCCYLCKVNIGVLLPESTLVPLGGGKGWAGYSMQDASNCPASQDTPLQEAKLSLHVASFLALSGVTQLNPLLDPVFLLLLMLVDSGHISQQLDRRSPARCLIVQAQQEAQLETNPLAMLRHTATLDCTLKRVTCPPIQTQFLRTAPDWQQYVETAMHDWA